MDKNIEELMSILLDGPAKMDAIVVKAIETLAQGAMASDRQLLELITALIDRVQKLEATEAARYELYHTLVRRQVELAELVQKSVDEMEALVKKHVLKKKDVH